MINLVKYVEDLYEDIQTVVIKATVQRERQGQATYHRMLQHHAYTNAVLPLNAYAWKLFH